MDVTVLVYISGPMTGQPELNRPAFMAAKAAVDRMDGLTGVTPFCVCDDPGLSYRQCLSRDLRFVTEEAAGVLLLDGWDTSPGAFAEYAAAMACGVPTYVCGPSGADRDAWLSSLTIDKVL